MNLKSLSSKSRRIKDASSRGIKLPASNLYFYGSKMDINGNSCAVFSFGANGRKWSVQTEAFDEFRKLNIRGNESAEETIRWTPEEQIEQAAIDYINKWGSNKLKDQLYIYDSVMDSCRVSDSLEDELEEYRYEISKLNYPKEMLMEWLDNQCLNWHILDYKNYRILCEENGIKPQPMGYQPRETTASKSYRESALYTM